MQKPLSSLGNGFICKIFIVNEAGRTRTANTSGERTKRHMHTFYGYRRQQGLPGVRNWVAIIPSVFCANTVVRRIAQQVVGAVELTHPVCCSQVGLDLELTAKALKGVGRHPNFYGVVVVGLGCERFQAQELADSIAAMGKPVEMVVIDKEVRLALKLVEQAAKQQKEEFPLSELCLGLKCGGTDSTSGIAANPALGWVTDQIVAEGGSCLLTAVTELIGAEHVLARRAVTPEVGQKILETVRNMENKLKVGTAHSDLQNRSALISPGNEDGGVTTVVEKALGGIDKGLSIPEVGAGLLQKVIETASGVPTKAEIGMNDELFCITRSYGG